MNVRLTFLLLAALLLFGGTVLVVTLTRSSERPPDQPWLFRIDENAMSEIEVTADGKTVQYYLKPGSETWYIRGDPDVAVDIQRWSGTTLLLSGPRVNRVLAEKIDNPAAFGLEPPKSIVKVKDRSGLGYEFHMGLPTPDGKNQYAQLVGFPQLFTVPEIWARVVNERATKPPYPPPDATPDPDPGSG